MTRSNHGKDQQQARQDVKPTPAHIAAGAPGDNYRGLNHHGVLLLRCAGFGEGSLPGYGGLAGVPVGARRQAVAKARR